MHPLYRFFGYILLFFTFIRIQIYFKWNPDHKCRPYAFFTFKSNGGLIWDDGEESSSNCSYTLNGSNLKIILNQDDYIEGTITISKNQATYKYTWHDYAGEWDDDTEYTMTLVKQ